MNRKELAQNIREELANDEVEIYLDIEDYEIIADALEQESRWIPISERLPKNDGFYLVTEKSGRVCTYVFHKEGNSEEYWKRCALAWMSLPKPYEPQESEG